MSKYTGTELVNRFFSGTGPTYDLMVRLCTFGLDIWWKKKIIEKFPENSTRIIDQACGTGILTLKTAQRFPQCQVVGIELRDEYLNIAQKKANRSGLVNVEFILGRAEDVLLDGPFDCITSSYLAKYADLGALILNARRMLRPRGVLIMHDFTHPPNPLFSRLWKSYFKILQRFGSWVYPQWRTIFYELPHLMQRTRWVNELMRALQRNVFSDISIESLAFGTSAIVTAKKR